MSVFPSFRLSTSISSRPIEVHPGLAVGQLKDRLGELARRLLGQVVTDDRDETPLVAPREEALVGRGGGGRAHPITLTVEDDGRHGDPRLRGEPDLDLLHRRIAGTELKATPRG